MMIDQVDVDLGARSYAVRIGAGLLGAASAEIVPILRRPKLWVVTEESVAALHLLPFQAGLQAAGVTVAALVLPAGESTKGWPQFARTVEWLLAEKVERRDLIVALGGGGDWRFGRFCRGCFAPWRAVCPNSNQSFGAG